MQPAYASSVDPLATDVCTRWRRDCTVVDRYALICYQPISGARDELPQFAHSIDLVAEEHYFDASVRFLG